MSCPNTASHLRRSRYGPPTCNPRHGEACRSLLRSIPTAAAGGSRCMSTPNRDDPWPEDTGRATRRIAIMGFLLGDDLFDQRAALIAALEQQGPDTLILPSFGSITATLDGDFTIGQRKELGRVLQVEFGVIQTGAAQPLYPVADASTQDAQSREKAQPCTRSECPPVKPRLASASLTSVGTYQELKPGGEHDRCRR